MGIGDAGLGKGAGLGGLGIGAVGIVRDWGPGADSVRIVYPFDNGEAIGQSPLVVNATGPAEVRVAGGAWAPVSGVTTMSDIPGWGAVPQNSSTTVDARLISDTSVATSITLTKRNGSLSLTSPSPGAYLEPQLTPTASSNLPRQARLVIDGTPSDWHDHDNTQTYADLSQPLGWPQLADTPIEVQVRHRDHPYRTEEALCASEGDFAILSPAANSLIESDTPIRITSTFGGCRTSCDGGNTWVTHWTSTAEPGPDIFVHQLGAAPTVGGAFTMTAKMPHTDNTRWEYDRAFRRSFELAFTAPAAGSDVNTVTPLTFSTFNNSGTVQAKLATEATWVNWDNTKVFGDLHNWGGTANGAISVELQVQEDTAQKVTRNFNKVFVPAVSITAPAAGSDIFNNSTSIVISTTGTTEVSWDASTWTIYSAGMRADAIGGWSQVGAGTVTLRAVLQSDGSVSDTRNFNKAIRSLGFVFPLSGQTVFANDELVLSVGNGTAEVRLGTGTWIDYTVNMRLDAIPGFTAASDGAITLNARLKEDTTITDSRGFTKATRTVSVTAPADSSAVRGSDTLTVSSTNTTLQARIGAASYAAFSSGARFDSLAGWGSVTDGSNFLVTVRSVEDNTVSSSRTFFRGQLAFNTPAANAQVTSTQLMTFTATGGNTAVEAQIQGQASWMAAGASGLAYAPLAGFSALAFDEAFTVDSRLIVAPTLTDSRAFRRGASLAITAPSNSQVVNQATILDLTHDGFNPQVRRRARMGGACRRSGVHAGGTPRERCGLQHHSLGAAGPRGRVGVPRVWCSAGPARCSGDSVHHCAHGRHRGCNRHYGVLGHCLRALDLHRGKRRRHDLGPALERYPESGAGFLGRRERCRVPAPGPPLGQSLHL